MNRTKQITRRILAMLLSLALLISVLPTFALGADTKDPLEKLDAKLVEALQNASAADQIPVWIWLDGPSRLALEDMIAQECGPEPGQGCTAEEANAYLAARRAVIKRETVAYNEKFMAEVLPEVSASDIGYFSKFTATIGAYLTVAQIRAAAYDARVNELSLYNNYEAIDDETTPIDDLAGAGDAIDGLIPGRDYVDGELLIGIKCTLETQEMTFCNVYCEDWEQINEQYRQNGRGQVAGSPASFCEQLGLNIPITEARLLNPSVNSERLPDGTYQVTYKSNSIYHIILGDISVADALDALSGNPLLEYAAPNHLSTFDDEPDKPATIQDQICADYYAWLKDPDISFEDVYIKQYLGCFNDYHIVVMGKLFADFQMVLELNVGGFIFEFPSTGYSSLFLAYKDGVFTPVTEAYKSGMLSVKDISDLYQAFYRDAQPPRFLDVHDPDAFYFEPVYWAYGAEITKGESKTRFGPDKGCTRGQVVTFLWRAAGMPEPTNTETGFTDLKPGAFYETAVAWAVEQGITRGLTDSTFGPDATCTRGQIVTFLYRANGSPKFKKGGNPFKDVAGGEFYADAVVWAVENGVTKGKTDKEFSPNATCTRGEVVTFLYRASNMAAPIDPDPDPKPGTKDLTEGYVSSLDTAPGPISDEAADAMADFTLNLFRAAGNPTDNTVLSPLSALYALAMLSNGAQGETRTQLEQAFGMDVQTLNETLRSFTANLPEKYGSTEVNLANSIWIRDGFRVLEQYLQDNADYLDASVFQAPFDDQTVEDMNAWINEQTRGLIPQMINGLEPSTVLTLINALYFCGKWAAPYMSSKSEYFYPGGGKVQRADMLHSTENTYLHDDQAAGFVKPFDSSKFAFAVLVPNEGVKLEDYIASLDGAGLRRLLQGERGYRVHAVMPKFKTETLVGLNEPLQAMGIRNAFDPGRADLSGIAEGLCVSQAKQKAVIELDEKGVKAAAVTVIDVEATAVPPEPTVTVTADRPYLYMIIDKTTNLPLFIGTTAHTDGEEVDDPDPIPIPDPRPVEPDPVPMRDLMEGYASELEAEPEPISETAADAMADFTLNMFRAAGDPKKNTVLSPLSALYALGMLSNGAQGGTRAELEQAFGMPVAELNEALRSTTANLPEGYGTTDVHLANSIWIKNGFEVQPQFLQDNANYYDAGAFEVPFDEQTVADINGWISEQTEGLIPEMIDELSPDTIMALVNALYFCGQWDEPYESTEAAPFHLADGTTQTAQMMRSSERIYLHDSQAQGFLKPFRSDKYAFAVVVPNEGVDLADYVAGLNGTALRKLLKGEPYDAVYAAMPKFQAETFVDLNEPLQTMGIRDAFNPAAANLDGIAPGEGLYVSKSMQKAVIDVDEGGVSAAAATVIAVEKYVSIPQKTVKVTADRPFLYMIIDRTTNLPLFIGTTTSVE